MPKVKIVEALCGCGKSYWAFRMMESKPDNNWLFVTPYLDEAGDGDKKQGRVQLECPSLSFVAPSGKSKLENLKEILSEGNNASITHKLFLDLDAEAVHLLTAQGYKVVIDETIEKVTVYSNMKSDLEDIKILKAAGFVEVGEDGKILWVGAGVLSAYKHIKDYCDKELLYLHNDRLIIRRESSKVYESVQEVFILTYMFDASPMRLWFDINKISYEYITPQLRISTAERKAQLRDLVTIEKPYDILEDLQKRGTEFSATYFKKASAGTFKLIQDKNDSMYMRWYQRDGNVPPRILFTCFKDVSHKVAGKKCRAGALDDPDSAWLAKNTRASNLYADRDKVMYQVNVYPHVDVKEYLDSFMLSDEDKLDSDKYALSEMIQFLFRSALREGQPTCIYILSRRMRKLLREWLETDY